MKEQSFPNDAGFPGHASPPAERVADAANGFPAHRPASAGRVVNVEIGELVLDGFGPLDSPPADARFADSGRATSTRPNARRPDSRHPDSGRLDAARAAEALRRELARELAGAGPDAERLAATIADAVFRQLSAPARRGGAR